MAYHQLGNVFASRQTHMDDVPRLLFNICESDTQLIETNTTRLVRARKIAPVLLGPREIPVLPLPNPDTGISHHGILLHNPLDTSRVVELMFRDTDLYFLGFRRGEATFLGDGTPQYHWGSTFVFDDLYKETPAFFEAIMMGLNSAHTLKGDCPGPEGMLQMFYTFYTFEEYVTIDVDANGISLAKGVHGKLKKDLEIAVGRAIIVFSEALRLSTIYREVMAGLQADRVSTPLSDKLWKLIHSWGTISIKVLEMRKRSLDLNKPLPAQDDYLLHGFTVLGDIIGQNGELVLCKMQVRLVISEKLEQRLALEQPRRYFADPTFKQQKEEDEVAEGSRGRRGRRRGRA